MELKRFCVCGGIKFIIPMFIGLILFSSCKKYKLDEYQEEFIGDYEWIYSTDSSLNSINQENTTDRYAVRIKKNSKVYVFKNGKEIYKGVITSLGLNHNGNFEILTQSNNEFVNFNYVNGNILSKDWPIENGDNYYLKL